MQGIQFGSPAFWFAVSAVGWLLYLIVDNLYSNKEVVICDFCDKEIYTNQDTGDQWGGVRFKIIKKTFLGLFGTDTREIDLCKDCYKKLTGKEYTKEWEGEND